LFLPAALLFSATLTRSGYGYLIITGAVVVACMIMTSYRCA